MAWKPRVLQNQVKLRPNSSYVACDGTKLFLHVPRTSFSPFSLVSAGPLHDVSVVLCDTPYRERTWPPCWFSQEIYVVHYVTFVTLWSTIFYHSGCFIFPSSSVACKIKILPLLHVGFNHIQGCQGITFYPTYSIKNECVVCLFFPDIYNFFLKRNLVKILSL